MNHLPKIVSGSFRHPCPVSTLLPAGYTLVSGSRQADGLQPAENLGAKHTPSKESLLSKNRQQVCDSRTCADVPGFFNTPHLL